MSNPIKKVMVLLVCSSIVWFLFSGNAAWADKKLTVVINDTANSELLLGAKWKLSTEEAWRVNGTDVALKDGTYKINFQTPPGYFPIPDEDVNISGSAVTLMVSAQVGTGLQVDNWPLWPIKPSPPYDSIIFDPLSFTIVGSDRNYLSWSEPIPNDDNVWGGTVLLSDLDTSTVTTTDSDGVFPTSRSMGFWQDVAGTKQNLNQLTAEDIGVLPRDVAEWVTVSADTASVEVSNQEVVGAWLSAWRNFLAGDDKGGGGLSYIGDTGHASPTMIYVDNIWIADMPGYRSYKTFLKTTYQSEGWGEGIILVPTNEGFLHAFATEIFEEKWATIPFPGQALGYYQEARKVASGADEEPRMNLLDGPLGFADIEGEEEGTWRRLVVGTAGTGLTLENKSAGYYSIEYLADEGFGTTEALAANLTDQYAPKTRNNPHFWGIYAVNLADNGSDNVAPSDPELLWSVSTVYFEEDSTEKGAVFVNGTRYDRSSEDLDDYQGFRDIRLSCARPVIGVTEGDDGNRQWHVVFVGITHEEEFHLYDLDAETGEILEDINLGNFKTNVYKDGAGTTDSILGLDDLSSTLKVSLSEVVWNERFEWKFPTRIGALAKDRIRDVTPDNLSTVQLYRTPLLKEVFVHLSNGALYRWDVSKEPSSTNPVLVALSVYQSDFSDPDPESDDVADQKDVFVAGPSTQDFDGTYLEVLPEEREREFHRFLALPLKGGDSSDGKKIDLRALVVLDVDNIVESGEVFLISQSNTWTSFGQGNKDRVDYAGDYGWSVPLAAGDANDGKYWNEVLTVSAPVFLDGHIILAGYQPPEDGESDHTSWIYNLDAQPDDNQVIVNQQTPYFDTEFVGGATINNSGPDGQARIFVGTSTGTTVSQDIEGVRWETGVGSGTSGSDAMQILYWKTN